MRAAYASQFMESVQLSGGREKQPLWYVMRIVGHKSDLLVQAVLDRLLPTDDKTDCGEDYSASGGAKLDSGHSPLHLINNIGSLTMVPTLAEIRRQQHAGQIIGSLGSDNVVERYVYPSSVLRKSDGRQRNVRHISPLLAGYIFCKASEETLVELVNRVPNFIFCYPRKVESVKRIIIRDDEMDCFIEALAKAAPARDVQIIPLDEARSAIASGTEVTLVGGLLDGLDGVMTSRESKRHLYMQVGGSFVLSIELKRNDKTERKAQVQGLKVI